MFIVLRPTFLKVVSLAAIVGVGVFGFQHLRPSSPHEPPAKPPVAAAAPAPVAAVAAAPAPAAPPSIAEAPVAVASLPAAVRAAAPPPPPPARPQRMTLAQEADFDAWMIKTYLSCWRPAAPPPDADPYVAQVRLAFKPDGSLSKPPKLVNPPANPALKSQAKSALKAVQNCNPLPMPAQYRPFYEQWKNKTIHFSPLLAAR